VVIFIVHLEWGPSSLPNTRPSGRSLTSYFYINNLPRLGKGGAQFAAHRPMLSLELGTLRLAYSFALAAGTLVDSSWRSGDGGKANCCSYRRRGSSFLSSISPLAVA
jgi:hypothetical protein